MDIIQNVGDKTSKIEWMLIDPDGNNASNKYWETSDVKDDDYVLLDPSPHKDHPELTMRHNMKIQIWGDANDKDKTQLRLQYLAEPGYKQPLCKSHQTCTPIYLTETNDELKQSRLDRCDEWCKVGWEIRGMLDDNKEFSCDPVPEAFKQQDDGGWERRFKCWWPHDFADPFWLVPDPPK